MASSEHWTHKLFVENAEVYLPFLEIANDRAQSETAAIVEMFGELGVPGGGKVLDVACGIGRHAIPLAKQEYLVTGVDISPLYIDMAREAAAEAAVDVRFLVGDMQSLEDSLPGGEEFDAFISMFTSMGYYGREGDLRLFGQMRELAKTDAALVVLTAHRDWMVRHLDGEAVDRAGAVRILQKRKLDLETSTLESAWAFFEGAGEDLSLKLRLEMEHRVYSLPEMRGLLAESGWRCVKALGSDRAADFELEELTTESKTMWIVARAA